MVLITASLPAPRMAKQRTPSSANPHVVAALATCNPFMSPVVRFAGPDADGKVTAFPAEDTHDGGGECALRETNNMWTRTGASSVHTPVPRPTVLLLLAIAEDDHSLLPANRLLLVVPYISTNIEWEGRPVSDMPTTFGNVLDYVQMRISPDATSISDAFSVSYRVDYDDMGTDFVRITPAWHACAAMQKHLGWATQTLFPPELIIAHPTAFMVPLNMVDMSGE